MAAKYNDQMIDYVEGVGGALTNSRIPQLARTATQLRVGASKVTHWSLANDALVDLYLHIYDALAVNVAPGTTTPAWSFKVKTMAVGSGTFPVPVVMTNGVTVLLSTTVDGSGAPAVGMLVNVGHAAA